MFLHIGNSKNIREKEIIGIFDADTATVSGITRKYLSACEKEDRWIRPEKKFQSLLCFTEKTEKQRSVFHSFLPPR